MPDHYYSADPVSASNPARISVRVDGREYLFNTDSGVFSKDRLDFGSALLIRSIERVDGEALDLGCGWGAIGIVLAAQNPDAHFTLCDVNRRAVELARENIALNGVKNACAQESDGMSALSGSFKHIITNPPIRAGKTRIYSMFDEAFARLVPGGAITIVIRKQQGAPSALKYLEGIFGNAEVINRGSGYWIIRSKKEEPI